MVRYLTVDELVYINENLPNIQTIHLELYGKRMVRDMSLLEAAAGRPQQSIFGQDAYPALPEKATALLHSIARNHPFADGNKRTATVAALFMLLVNGFKVTWNAEEAVENIVAMAEGQQGMEEFAAWLPMVASVKYLEQDAERDMMLLYDLMQAHLALLEALAER